MATLHAGIDHEVAGTAAALDGPGAAPGDEERARELAEHGELSRQLGALRDRVVRAESQIRDPRELRAELATLLFFARTLRTDAERFRARAHEALEELAREQAAARLEQERLAAEREAVLRRREALRAKIGRTAEEIAEGDRTECRGTVPVTRLGEGVTVCSMAVASPKRPFRARDFWLVTLAETGDEVLVRRA